MQAKAWWLFCLSVVLACLNSCTGIESGTERWPQGCSPQLRAVYRVLTTVPTGILEISLTDAVEGAQASASVVASFNGPWNGPRPQCPSSVSSESDGSGMVRFERMRPGNYDIWVYTSRGSASASGIVQANQVSRISINQP